MLLKTISLRNAGKYIIVFLLIVLSLIIGCNEASVDDKEKASFNKNSESAKESEPEVMKNVTGPGDVVAAEVIDLTLYFASANGDKLIKTVQEVEKTDSVAKMAMERLILGPAAPDRYRSVPVGTGLISISVEGGNARVDLSKEFIDGHGGGSAEEIMSVYSIVNTLTEFSTIEAVIFLVEGKKIETITGHLDLSEPTKRRDDLIAP